MLQPSNKQTLSFVQRRFTALPEFSGSTFKKKDLLLMSRSSQRDDPTNAQNLAQLLRGGLPASTRSKLRDPPKVASTGQRAAHAPPPST